MTFKAFFIRSLLLSLGIAALVALFNFYMNDYGLFGDVKGKRIKIYGDERTAKYLLSFNYIPSNFDGLLIGSSVSDNIDSKDITRCRTYNGSINGGTVAELKLLVDNVLAKGTPKCVIICLYPILTESGQKRSSRMAPREYWSSLGSINTIEFYRSKLLVACGWKEDFFNEYGCYNFNLRKAGNDSRRLIQKSAARINPDESIPVDGRAYEDLYALLKTLRARAVKIFAYYHPVPQDCFILSQKSYRSYQEKINALFRPGDVVWDYNTEEFTDFRKDYSNYCDDIHLSLKGVDAITRSINAKISSQL